MRRLFLALPLLLAAASQASVEWIVHTDPSHLYELSLTDEAVWGAGRGGALRLDRSDGGIRFLRTTDGLPVNDLGSVLALSEEEISQLEARGLEVVALSASGGTLEESSLRAIYRILSSLKSTCRYFIKLSFYSIPILLN